MNAADGLELRHMRHFVAVAEELHFGRAAARLGMAQPPLSQSIKRLEGTLGVALLARTQRRVELTPAGRAFLDEARRTLAQADAAVRLARRAAIDDLTELRVTFVSAALYRVLPAALRAYRATFPQVEIRLDERPTDVQLELLADGSVDVGFVHPPLKDAADLEVRMLHRDRLVAAIAAPGPLARRVAVELAELADEGFVLFPYRQGPNLHARITGACRRAGFVPRIAQEATQMHTILSLVAAGMGVSLVPERARMLRVEGVSFVPVRGLPDDLTWDLALAWRSGGAHRPLRAFVDTVLAVEPDEVTGRRPVTR
jgi:DNA-binding transcriptional LysR family regulator